MADPRGFLNHRERQERPTRPVPVRIMDYKDVYVRQDEAIVRTQATRCMDCGVPFCHAGCPLGNLIPDWNDLVRRGRWEEAAARLHATNNFPEITGRICPAPCESSCVLGINQPAVTIKQVELSIAEQIFENDWLPPHRPHRQNGHTVAVVGSGPAGLAAAQQLTRAGYTVAVYERDDRLGGLLRYGIPDFKLEKDVIDRRIAQMEAEGTRFRTGVEIGTDIAWDELKDSFDAVVVATGAPVGRDLPIPGRGLEGIHLAMDYLVPVNRRVAGGEQEQISAEVRNVVILGGGDTGADCIGTAHRQGAASVTTLAIGRQPPSQRPSHQPWPTVPTLFEVASAHAEGGERTYLASTVEFLGDERGRVRALKVAETEYLPDGSRSPKAGTEHEIPADLVLLALGFTGVEQEAITEQTGVQVMRGVLGRDDAFQTAEPGVFVCGDAGRGASLVVWAIAEGRATATAVDEFLTGEPSDLPAPVKPRDRGLVLG
ncbi:glutamate synthase subunit beta [Micrococcus lylae]|uniref:glutamate synthase subunit beta n=1 Tax=Micrococcus lylae TaxID=1273 RepID=UPI0021A64803|nr:glutamate synthase subunit beta [Micrococcus lylae]MCT2007324.1 glutamate synthase subunit beta [Micrococcus lylae]MCT2071002.1 glutamate synthase subunit beta [Micrococcus lylae]